MVELKSIHKINSNQLKACNDCKSSFEPDDTFIARLDPLRPCQITCSDCFQANQGRMNLGIKGYAQDCGICFETEPNTAMYVPQCGHTVCQSCLDQCIDWCLSSIATIACPSCKQTWL